MSVFSVSAALNMYFVVVELRVLPNVFGQIMELSICIASFMFSFIVMVTLVDHPWNWLSIALIQVLGLISIRFLPPAKPQVVVN